MKGEHDAVDWWPKTCLCMEHNKQLCPLIGAGRVDCFVFYFGAVQEVGGWSALIPLILCQSTCLCLSVEPDTRFLAIQCGRQLNGRSEFLIKVGSWDGRRCGFGRSVRCRDVAISDVLMTATRAMHGICLDSKQRQRWIELIAVAA